jgi:hypothetical protein
MALARRCVVAASRAAGWALIWREDMTLASLCRGPLLAGLLVLQGCAEYRVAVPDPDPVQLEGQKGEYLEQPMDAYFWGNIVEPQVVTADCEGEGIDDVSVHRTRQQQLISVLTLGIWMPGDVRYRCKAPPAAVFPEPKPR